MIQNAQLDNEKSAVLYQVELFKDKYQDLEAAYSVLQVSRLSGSINYSSMMSDYSSSRSVCIERA